MVSRAPPSSLFVAPLGAAHIREEPMPELRVHCVLLEVRRDHGRIWSLLISIPRTQPAVRNLCSIGFHTPPTRASSSSCCLDTSPNGSNFGLQRTSLDSSRPSCTITTRDASSTSTDDPNIYVPCMSTAAWVRQEDMYHYFHYRCENDYFHFEPVCPETHASKV